MRGLLQIARVRIFGPEGQFEDTLAACDTGASQTWVDDDLIEKLDLDSDTITLSVTGIHGTQETPCRTARAAIGPANCMESKAKSLTVYGKKKLAVGKTFMTSNK